MLPRRSLCTVLFASLAIACGGAQREPTSAANAADEPSSFDHKVPYELGDVEFASGDAIQIDEIRGDRDTFEVGGTYEVVGHYRLHTKDEASLLLSVTVNNPPPDDKGSPTDPRSKLQVKRGEGDFKLVIRLDQPGNLHVTYYAENHPFGGVYFGSGPWLLRKKSWSYLAEAERTRGIAAVPQSSLR